MKLHISCEGNIGAGKTTIIEKIKVELQKQNVETTILPEPVEKWTNWTFENSTWNLLDLQYQNKAEFATPFQIVAGITKCNQIHENIKNNETTFLVERSLMSQKMVFVPLLKLTKLNLSIVDNLLETFMHQKEMNPDIFIYLRTTPATAMNRVVKRGRPEEADITLDLLERLHQNHEDWLLGTEKRPVVVVENDADGFDGVGDVVSRILKLLK